MKDKIIQLDLGGVNSYLIPAKSGFILVDTGGHIVTDKQFTSRSDLLISKMHDAGCTKENLNLILLTHGDNDHAANAPLIKKTFHAPIAMHKDDLHLTANPTLEQAMQSYLYKPILYKIMFFLLRKTIRKVTAKMIDNFTPFEPDILLQGGERIDEYGVTGTILHVPGHTPGSIALLLDNGVLIAGDLFVNNQRPQPAPNAQNFSLLYKSILKVKQREPIMVYPGHGQPFQFSSLHS